MAGPGVVPLQSGFAHNWLETTGELVTGDAFFPQIPERGRLAVQTLLSSPETGWNSVRLYGALLKAGIPILEYNRTMLHQKTMVVDGVWATVGTTNFDDRSFAHNEESNVCFFDQALAVELHQRFLSDLEGCDPVTLAKWRARGLWSKTQETVASFLKEQA